MKPCLRLLIGWLMLPFPTQGQSESPAPGIVIHHQAAASRLYIGSPSLCVMPDGSYLASHDLFGPASNEHELAKARLYRSGDQGKTWQHVTDFDGYFWTGIFTHRGAAYTLGTDKHHGKVVIRRSSDSGKTWSDPFVLAEGEWHTAPMPVIEHDGRLWRAIEDAMGGTQWGERYRARMMSAPVDADLLDPKSWTFSNPLPRDPTWLGGDFAAWLEGNAVADPQGNLVNLLRVDNSKPPEKSAIVRLSKDGTTATFDPAADFIDFPGGAKKFTIRQDPKDGGYWSIASTIPERHAHAGRPGGIRNTLGLVHSRDLRTWEIRCVLLYHPDVAKHGFQYVDWQFEGDDLIAACRTAWDDTEGGAHNNHDANFLTFHRWKNFRSLTRKDDVPLPEFIPVVHESADFTIHGNAFEIAPLKDGETAFSNRGYKWAGVPGAFAGWSFTRLGGGEKPFIDLVGKRESTVRIATATDQEPVELGEWQREPLEFYYDDHRKTRVHVFSRVLRNGNTLRLPSGNWTGSILLFSESP